jgi:hypothetical protein
MASIKAQKVLKMPVSAVHLSFWSAFVHENCELLEG